MIPCCTALLLEAAVIQESIDGDTLLTEQQQEHCVLMRSLPPRGGGGISMVTGCVPVGDDRLAVLANMWDRVFTEILPTLQAIFYPVQVHTDTHTHTHLQLTLGSVLAIERRRTNHSVAWSGSSNTFDFIIF